jgi:hypothetical protein
VPYFLAGDEDPDSGLAAYVDAAFADSSGFEDRSGSAHPGGLHEPEDWLPVRVTGQHAHPLAESCHAEPIYDHGEDPRQSS